MVNEVIESAKKYSQAAKHLLQKDETVHSFVAADDVGKFVSCLFQSLEHSMRYAALRAGLISVVGEGNNNIERCIESLDSLVSDRLEVPGKKVLSSSVSHYAVSQVKRDLIMKMASGHQFESTRKSLSKGRVDLESDKLSVVKDPDLWSEAVSEVADNIEQAVDILVQFRESDGNGSTFITY